MSLVLRTFAVLLACAGCQFPSVAFAAKVVCTVSAYDAYQLASKASSRNQVPQIEISSFSARRADPTTIASRPLRTRASPAPPTGRRMDSRHSHGTLGFSPHQVPLLIRRMDGTLSGQRSPEEMSSLGAGRGATPWCSLRSKTTSKRISASCNPSQSRKKTVTAVMH